MQLLRREEVCQRIAVSGPTLYRMVKFGGFPAPIRVGPRASRWREDEVEKFLQDRPRSTDVAAR